MGGFVKKRVTTTHIEFQGRLAIIAFCGLFGTMNQWCAFLGLLIIQPSNGVKKRITYY